MHRTLRTLLVALATLALSALLAVGTLFGAFDVGPGGSPVPSGPWYNTAGEVVVGAPGGAEAVAGAAGL